MDKTSSHQRCHLELRMLRVMWGWATQTKDESRNCSWCAYENLYLARSCGC